jgi:CRP-like cAMP-binding protein
MTGIDSMITSHPLLKTMSPENLELMTRNAREVEFGANEVIFRKNEPANRLFLIQSGRVVVEDPEKSGVDVVDSLGIGDVLGWSWLFPPFSWHFTARATEPTRAIVLDGGHLLVTAEENPKFGYELMKRVAKILIHRLEKRGGE